MLLILVGCCGAVIAYLLLRRRTPEGWTAITDGNDYGAIVDPATGNFAFPQAPNSVHYVTKACDGLRGTQIRLRYRIDGGPFTPASDPKAQAIGPTLYFQRKDDDWQTDGLRWWATFAALAIVPGEHEVVAPFDAKWTSVEHYNSVDNTAAFVDALKNAARVGFTFGGGTGYGHGVYGEGLFTLLEFAVE